MTAHARLSPSSADRWMTCPGSVAACAGIGEDRSSEYAAEGTIAHEIRALCLEYGFEPHDFIGRTLSADGFSFEIDDEMADHLQVGIDRVRETPGRVVVEHRVDLGRWLPGQFGTLDTGVVDPASGTMRIIDLKYGQGVQVEARENRQLRIYALGFWDNVARHICDIETVVLEIEQPRAGGTSEWSCTLDELLAFGEEVRAAGVRTYEPDAPFVASEKGCKWCPLNPKLGGPGCAELDRFVLEMVDLKFADLDQDIDVPPALPSTLSPERRSYVVQHAKMLTDWLDAMHARTIEDALAGLPTPGLKAVVGRAGRREWIEGANADRESAHTLLVSALGDDAFTKKLKSPAEAEKELKPGRKKPGHPETWQRLQAFIAQGEGKPILVRETDPRPALRTIEDRFSENT